MTKDDLLPFIEYETDRFWGESINPKNSDSTFIQHGIDNIESIYNDLRSDSSALLIVNSFLKMNYLLKEEYFISYTNNIVLTNRRIFLWFSDLKKTIPLCKLTIYEKLSDGLHIEYLDKETVQKLRISSKWLKADIVHNAINRHKDFKLTDEELEILSNLKPAIQAIYGFITNVSDDDIIPPVNAKSTIQVAHAASPILIQKPKSSYRVLIRVLIFLLFISGCVYFVETKFDNSANNTVNTNPAYNSVTGKKKKKCPWCGGIGRVGYAGDSKAQVEKTGMGLGNYCTTCNGTGYVDEDTEK